MNKPTKFITGMLAMALVLGMAGCDSAASGAAQKVLQGMTSYTIVLGSVVSGSSYTAVVYDDTEAVGSGEALAENGSASIRLTPYNGKPAFSERPYRVKVSSGTAVRESDSVDFVAGGNTHVDWGKMTVISGEQDGDDNSKGMSSYTIVLDIPYAKYGATYTAVVYDSGEAIGGGVADGSTSIRLTPYNGKPPFSEKLYRVRVSSEGTVKEALVAFVVGGNTPLNWGTMTVISAYTSEDGISTWLVLTEILSANGSGATYSASAPKIGEAFNYELYRSGDRISSGRVTLNSAASWTFTSSTGGFAFTASFSGGTLTFYGKINDTVIGSDIKPVSGVPAPQNAPSGGGLFTLTGVDTGIYRIEVYYFTDDIEDAASWAEATNPENMVLSTVISAQSANAGVTLKGINGVFDETDTFLVVVTEVALMEDENVTKYSIVEFEDGKASIDWEEDMEPPPESDDTGTNEINTVAKAAVTFTGGGATLEYADMYTAPVEPSGTDDPIYTVTFNTGGDAPPVF